jgi:hypothetical protein
LISHLTGRSSGAASPFAASLLAVFAVALTLFLAADVRAQDPAPTNLDVMVGLGNQVVEDIIGKINTDVRGVRLEIVWAAETEEYQVLDDIFTRLLEERGIDTVHRASDDDESLYSLEYKVPVFRLTYPKVYRSHLIGGKKVKREANLRVTARLVSDTGDVVWIGESSAEKKDQFSHGDLSRIQEGSYQFVKPEMPGSGWGKVVEPVLVSAIIVGMVYLFFSNQSDS